MRIGTMLRDVIRSIFQRPATDRYPYERRPPPERLRGKLVWDPAKCTGCCLCGKECPSNSLELITLDKANKRFVMRYHVDRCAFCEQCVLNCRFGCLEMSNEAWELASLDKAAFTVHYGDETDVESVLEKLAQGDGPESAD
ncbi:MAG TPA: 4Fe-4S binding protein [Anaerolineales bacterium]|nr:4Fe-4S binding protein [Anaerolineales bacterium]